jgi:hypothetical protein
MKSELSYHDWLLTVDKMVTRWSMWRLEVYRLAMYIGELAFLDLNRIVAQEPAFEGDDFLLQACKIGAKIAFGHGPGFRTIQLEGFGEALASARAARQWYEHTAEWLGVERTRHRLKVLDIITNNLLLLTQIPPGFDPEAYDDEHWDDPIAGDEEWEEGDDNSDNLDDFIF